MSTSETINAADLAGYAKLAIDSVTGVVDLVEAMHATIARRASPFSWHGDERTAGITGLVYRAVRVIPNALSAGIDHLLPAANKLTNSGASSREREVFLAALNGVLGDRLAESNNPLATPMGFRIHGQRLPLHNRKLAAAVPRAKRKIMLFVHGLCMSDLQWARGEQNHAATLAAELGHTEVHLLYNSGRQISHNGRELTACIEALLATWPEPVDELTIVAHSMGGLLARSALYHAAIAGHHWPRQLRKLVFLGTPHHGAPLEKGGSWLDTIIGFSPYSAPFSRLGKLRSAGITDLRYGNLCDQDWNQNDRFKRCGDQRQVVPLPDGVRCYALAACMSAQAGRLADKLVGDGLVPLDSALGQHANPEFCLPLPKSRTAVFTGMNHFDLLSRPEVLAQLQAWLAN